MRNLTGRTCLKYIAEKDAMCFYNKMLGSLNLLSAASIMMA